MLKSLHLENVGPAPEMSMQLGPRLNIITGDNGLGKSFLLDVAWWTLTKKWPRELNVDLTSGYPARPTNRHEPGFIESTVTQSRPRRSPESSSFRSKYDASEQVWTGTRSEAWNSGLVIYVLADGGFAVWDPYRNGKRTEGGVEVPEHLPAYVFSSREVWDGLDADVSSKSTRVCNGLLADWASWIREKGDDAARMAAVLAKLGPVVGGRPLEPGPNFARLSVYDVRDIPTVRMSYSENVPILYASLGVRRIAALAYILCWAWREHRIAADLVANKPVSQIVLLFDEIEAHLHPRWQRAIVPSLLEVMNILTADDAASVQLVAATHSPLVLASIEPEFDTAKDKLFTLDFQDGAVALREEAWAKQGDVINWLVSDSFGLHQGRSIEAEVAIEAAEAWMRGDRDALPTHLSNKQAIHGELVRVLAGHDPFWPRWIVTAEAIS